MHITVAICTWNRSTLLAQTLDQLTRIVIPPGVDWELLVVNNNCSDATDDVLAAARERLPLRRVFEPTPGKSHALNRTLREAHSDLILWTDDDVLVDEGWLAAFARVAASHPEAALFGGPIEPFFDVDPPPDFRGAFPALAIGFCGLDYDRLEGPLPEGCAIWGANMACRRSALGNLSYDTQLGPLESSCRVGEDGEFVAAVRDSGGEVIWAPDMKVRHYVPQSRTTLEYLMRYYTGMGRTHVRRTGMPPGRIAFGAPGWVWRRCVEAYVRYAFGRVSLVGTGKLQRLRWVCFWKGVVSECRELRREQRLDNVRSTA